jgi:heptosyltransferase-2
MTPFISAQKFARRPKSRWKRVLEFKLGMPQFPQPFRGAHSFVTPLEEWGVRIPKEQGKWLEVSESQIAEIKSKINLPKHYVTFAPSAAWEMKRWPISHWEKLIQMWKASPIVLLGGQNDHFIKDLARENEVINLAGKTSLMESAFIIAGSDQVVSADTGLLHIADGLGIPCMALIGPTAFGFPSHPHSKILEVDLSCRPCSKDGRGRCKQKVYQRCMVDISPQRVWEEMQP